MSLRKEWRQDTKNRRRFSKPLSFASFICGDRENKDYNDDLAQALRRI